MDWRGRLAVNLTTESEAYGYTLTIWGTGAILISQYSTPGIVQILSYVGGALAGFAALMLLAFQHLFDHASPDESKQLITASAIHVLATGGNLAVAYLLVRVLRLYTSAPEAVGFLLLGFQATVTYNLLLLGEAFLVRVVPSAERGETE